MSGLVDSSGNPLAAPEQEEQCPMCRSTDLETVKGFGGWWRLCCKKCGSVVTSGRTGRVESE